MQISKNLHPINPPWEATGGYTPPNREVNHESSGYGVQETEAGIRNDQGEGEEKSQGKSYAPGVENHQCAYHGLSCAFPKFVC